MQLDLEKLVGQGNLIGDKTPVNFKEEIEAKKDVSSHIVSPPNLQSPATAKKTTSRKR